MSATGPDRGARPAPRLTLSGFLVCRTIEEADRVAALLPEHTRLSRAEPGCLRFEVWRSQADPCRFAVSERFRDRAAFEAHQARAGTTVWARATSGIPRHYVIAEEADQLP